MTVASAEQLADVLLPGLTARIFAGNFGRRTTSGDTACSLTACSPNTGVCVTSPQADGANCSDGNPCTTDDVCVEGLCEGAGSDCVCLTDADCEGFEDGDLCNGTLKCLGFQCVVDEITVVECNPASDTTCVKNACDPASGQCVKAAP